MVKMSLLGALCLLALAGCATPAQVVESGPFDLLRGKAVSILMSPTSPDGDLNARAASAVMARLEALGARPPQDGRADYHLQVTVSILPAKAAVSRTAPDAPIEAGWSSPPYKRRLLDRPPGAAYALCVVALDGATGKVALTATATDRGGGPIDAALPRLTSALFAR